jgi:hypothetical protein
MNGRMDRWMDGWMVRIGYEIQRERKRKENTCTAKYC